MYVQCESKGHARFVVIALAVNYICLWKKNRFTITALKEQTKNIPEFVIVEYNNIATYFETILLVTYMRR